MKTCRVGFSLVAMFTVALQAVAGSFVAPTNITGVTPSGIAWSDVATGTALPVRTSGTWPLNGAPGAVLYVDTQTGQMQLDPKGLSIRILDVTFTTGTTPVSSSTPGPFQYTTGSANLAYSPISGAARTFPARDGSGGGLNPLTFASRFYLYVGTPVSAFLNIGTNPNSASSNGDWNLPWAFPSDLVAPGAVSTVAASFNAPGSNYFRTLRLGANANANILGYGSQQGVFQYNVRGVFGDQVGAVIPVNGVPQPVTVTLDATSGTGTISTNYSNAGGLTINNAFYAEYLVVGGGGGGGGSGDNGSAWGGGGGGAGGLLTGTTTLSSTSYTVTVGGGGAGGQFSATAANQQGSNGANSLFGSIATGTGGGGGGSFKVAGNNGGSGGGGGGRGTGNDLRTPGGTGVAGQGNNGGASRDDDSAGRSAGGGGGGAGAVGGTGGTNVTTAGNGGAGVASSITGSSVTYAGGGGGGAWDTFSGQTAGTGGTGGGGAGSTSGSATAGTDGLGGGGGGVGTNGAGGRGGAGQVIVRYQGASLGTVGGTVTSGSGSAAGYTLHTFTTSGTTTATSALDLSGVDMNARLGVTITGTITGAGSLTFAGPGTLTLAASNSFNGDTRISSGTLAIGNAGALQSSTLDMNSSDSGAITFSQDSSLGGLKGSRSIDNGGHTLTVGGNGQSTTYSGVVSGSGGLTKSGVGSLTLTASTAYTGDTRISAGSLVVANADTLAGSTLDMNASDSGTITFSQDSNIGGLQGSRNLDNGGKSLAVGGNNQSTTYSGGLSGIGGLTKTGTGTLTLTGSNTFGGNTTVSAGTLVLGSGNALSTTAAVTVASGATLESTTPIRIGYLESAGTVTGSNNLTATLTVTRSGSIGGIANGTDSQGTFAAGIVKLGTGTSTVNTANTYTGLTWVREGTLVAGVANAFAASSDLTVDSGATFDRAGYAQTYNNAVVNGIVDNSASGGLLTVTGILSGTGEWNGPVAVSGVHAPGNSPGVQTFTDDLSYLAGAAVNWELTGNTTSNGPVVYDQVVLSGTGNLTFSGSTGLNLSFDAPGSLVDWFDEFWNESREWTIYDLGAGSTTGIENLSLTLEDWVDGYGSTLSSIRGGATFSVGQVGGDVVLTYAIATVPEPSTIAMALVGLAGGGYLARRRRTRV